MAIFWRSYNKPGPGVDKEAPQKKGAARFLELFALNFGRIVKLNLLYQCFLLPSQVFLFAAFFVPQNFWLFLALSVLAGLPIGGAKTAFYFCISKMFRDEPGFLWHDFIKSFKENFKQGLFVGLLFHASTVSQIALALNIFFGNFLAGVPQVIFIVSVLLLQMVAPYYFLQLAYLKLQNPALFKNSVLLAVGNLPRSFCGALANIASAVAIIIFQLVSFPIAVFFGYAFPAFICLFFIWKPVDSTFKISETLKEREKALLIEE